MANVQVPFGLGTFESDGRGAFPGVVLGDRVYPFDLFLTDSAPTIGTHSIKTTLDIFDKWDVFFEPLAQWIAQASEKFSERALQISNLKILAPVRPRQILCTGGNYRSHIVQMLAGETSGAAGKKSPDERRAAAEEIANHWQAKGQPFAYCKPVSAILDPSSDLVLPADSAKVDWELELGVVIGRPARRVSRKNALDYVAGYTVVNDISARDHIDRPDFSRLGPDWIACKSAPGFLPIGPLIVPKECINDPQKLQLTLRVNGKVMQDESTVDMVFPVTRIIEYLSTYMQLLPGDVICTGSPAGNAAHHGRFLQDGDIMEGSIENLGTQRIRCVSEKLDAGAVRHAAFVPFQARGSV